MKSAEILPVEETKLMKPVSPLEENNRWGENKECYRGMPKAKRIDILVSSSEDVQKERFVTEQSIRRVAAEFDLPVSASYCDGLRRSKQNETTAAAGHTGEDGLLLCPYFLEHQDSGDDLEHSEQILNPGQYDLVVKILWSRLGARLTSMHVMPDSSQPGSATEYEAAWALHASQKTPGVPELQVYRNRAAPATVLEPREKREDFCRQWDAVQEFCAAWEYGGTKFRDCCHEYQELEEFENLFREQFRDFLVRQLDREIGLRTEPRKPRYLESNPYRGLHFFDFEHADFFHGRTKAVWEVLDALKDQATAKKRFVLVLGQEGSGKSSLVRAGVLPLLTQGGTPVGNGPWRRAVTRPVSGGGLEDPIETLAAALFSKGALPELQDEESTLEWQNLASRLAKNPDAVAARIAVLLDQLGRPGSERLETEDLPEKSNGGVEAIEKESLERTKPKAQLALVIDQLEELFTGGVSPFVQRKYISALSALAKCQGVFVIATLRSRFYPHCQQFPELIEVTGLSEKYELQSPTPRGFGNMIRFPAEAVGLRFEQAPDTKRCLDEALVTAAMASPEPLPLLEHVLSRLYLRQLDRKDGMLRWSDYYGLGELQGALALHEKTVFSTLKPEEKLALKSVIRHLVVSGRGEEAPFIRRTVPYNDLFSSSRLNQYQKAGAKGLVDRLVKEGLLRTDASPQHELLISVPQEALLRRWPGVWQWLSEDRHFFQMRERLDANLEVWLGHDRQKDDLLNPGIELTEAEALLRHFGPSLSESQIEYIQKSLARQKRRSWVRDNLGLAAVASFAVFAAYAGVGRFNTERRRTNSKQDIQPIQQNGDLTTSQQRALETELTKAQDNKAQLAAQNTDLANSQNALATQLKKAQEEKEQLAKDNQDEKAQLVKQNADRNNNQSAVESELKKAQDQKAQLAKQNADLTNHQSALAAELKKAQDDKAQLAKQNTDLANSQNALATQLNKAQEEKAQLAKQSQDDKGQVAKQMADLTSNQSALQTELKKAEEKAQIAQQNSNYASSQHSALDTELKKARDEKAQLTKQNVDLTNNQAVLATELKKAQDDKAQLAKQNTDLANSQNALAIQLNKAQEDKAQLAKQSQDEKDKLAKQMADLTSNQSALQTELKKAEEKAQIAQQNSDYASNQHSALDTELKKAQDEKGQLVKQIADLTNNQGALATELKKAQDDKTQLVKQNTDLANSQNALAIQLNKAQEDKAQLARQSQDEKGQLAKQNADLTNNQSALATELKKAQDEKANLAKQNTDLANSQNALATQLNKAQEEKAQLAKQSQDDKGRVAKQIADLTSNQSALQTELKKAEEKAQMAQQNTDLASNQNALATQLNKAQEEKTQLAKQNTDLTNNQSALAAELKKAQEENTRLAKENQDEKAQLVKQNADLTNNQSALAAELKNAQEQKAQLAKESQDEKAQIADLTSNQSALEAELKNPEDRAQPAQPDEKVQLAKQNADVQDPDLPAGQQSAPEAKSENAEERVQPAKEHADLSTRKHKARENRSRKARESRVKKVAVKSRPQKSHKKTHGRYSVTTTVE